ncbi:MAG: hypothetical protein HRU77_03115 [Gammaproteobacteria bacterium]|jgi:hypothetical protein|nr:hypothetical protein [Pseudomonadota bacterium]QOJ19768.1 MAG: hypothetical protein HRU77_03115 [Gammaproteobacteria bacterium]
MRKQESEIKSLKHDEELTQRLEALAERNPEAMAALQLVLPALSASANNIRTQSFSEDMANK